MVIDTTFAVDVIREARDESPERAIQFLRKHDTAKLRMPVFVLCELELGVARSGNRIEAREATQRFGEFVEVVYPEPGFAEIYAEIVSDLLGSGTPIPLMDALISTVAVQHNEPLVTRDTGHFGQVDRLTVLTY